MSRRIVPWTFWAGIFCSVLLANTLIASKPPVPRLVGTWDGFFQPADSAGTFGLVRSNITQQKNRRLAGNGMLLSLDGVPLTRYNFNATLASDDSLSGNGRTPAGRLVFNAGLETFAGRLGSAGVLHPEILFVPARGNPGRLSELLLHPFPDTHGPDISGMGMGTFQSQNDPNLRGDIALEIFARERGTFPGHVDFTPTTGSQAPFSWRFLGTTSDNGRLVFIAEGKTGKLVADGVVVPQGVSGSPVFIGGFYRLLLNNGQPDFGAYNFNLIK